MANILLVEDDTRIRNFIEKGLKEVGHTVDSCDNAYSAYDIVYAQNIDLVIVDIMLKGSIDGIQMISSLRKEGITSPVIFLSARDRVEDKVAGFKVGGDDYLTKPFSFVELKARVENLLRRAGNNTQDVKYEYHGLVLNVLTRQVEREDKTIPLQRREFMLLQYFMENPEQVLGKTMILERIWGFDFDPQTNVVDVLMFRLRSKIDKNFDTQLLHTVRGMGYILKAQ